MTASIAYQIVQAVSVKLTTPAMASVIAANVRTEPISPVDVETGTALNIELGDEGPATFDLIGVKGRATELKLTAIASGSSAVVNADAVIVEAHARLMADETLGGLCFDMTELGVRRENAASGKRLSIIEKTYLVNYRTSDASLSS